MNGLALLQSDKPHLWCKCGFSCYIEDYRGNVVALNLEEILLEMPERPAPQIPPPGNPLNGVRTTFGDCQWGRS